MAATHVTKVVHSARPRVVHIGRTWVVRTARPRPVQTTRPSLVQYSPAGDKEVENLPQKSNELLSPMSKWLSASNHGIGGVHVLLRSGKALSTSARMCTTHGRVMCTT